MDSQNQDRSYGGYYNPQRCRSDSDYLKNSASSNYYRKQKKTYVAKVKKILQWPVEKMISFKTHPISEIKPTNKFLDRKFSSSKDLTPGWRNTPKLIKSDLDAMTKALKSLLNKLTPTNFDTILEKLSEQFNSETSLIFSSLLLNRACIELKYSETYSQLARDLIRKFHYFRNDLLISCQTFFESQALEAQDISLNKKKVLGCVSFIGQLLNMRILPAKVVISCCQELLKKNTEETAEGVSYLLSTCSSFFNSSKFKETAHDLINELQFRSNNFSSRLKFQVQDLIENRKIQAIMTQTIEKPRNLKIV